jgi:DNA helicase-2/ATP-dependent DNA helicase PcrA
LVARSTESATLLLVPATTDDIIFGGLNAEQRQAVEQVKGPVLILAGAGSGKTRALTHRIAFLISQGVQPWQILSVTFTNKAAKEMKERIKTLLQISEGNDLAPWDSGQGKLPTMGTFHSICVRILRRDIEMLGRDKGFVIYDGDDQEKLMKTVLKDMKIGDEELKARAALSYIGKFKSEALTPSMAAKQSTTDRFAKIAQVYTKYQAALKASNAVDFDDLILITLQLFREFPDVLARYQETWRYIHVDEYQDTNHGQYELITMLAQKYRNICVIGDPDQSIYGFRGADIRNILEFEKEYPDAIRIKLEQNYRSTQPILSAADHVISQNPNRPEKKMWTERTVGPKIIVNEVRDERREAEEVAKAVQQMQQDGTNLSEQVILYRTHAQSRVFEEACMRAGIPYRMLGGVKFYARKEVKDVLAYLYTILNTYDMVSMLRVINIPSRKIGDTTIAKIQAYSAEHGMPLWDCLLDVSHIETLDAGTKDRIKTFTALITLYRGMSQIQVASVLAEQLLEDIKMETWLKEGEEKADGEDRWRNVQELLTVMHKYDSLNPQLSLTSFLEEVALVSEVDKLSEGRTDALTLMTLHLCKGLEFDHVMIVGCEEGLFPHSNAMFDKDQMEEERRIMYVGMTRAKTQLRLFYAKSRYMWGEGKSNPPSRFLDDLPEEFIERRSDEILSAFSWSSGNAEQRMRGGKLEPFRQDLNQDIEIEFNQDVDFGSEKEPDIGSRVQHPVFGKGTIRTKRGDIVEIQFDGGQKKTFALSIAPLKMI